jgi:hypothetical protein
MFGLHLLLVCCHHVAGVLYALADLQDSIDARSTTGHQPQQAMVNLYDVG